MTMLATVCQVYSDALLVCDHATHQEVVVNTSQAASFQPGNQVRIQYSGAMTRSIPPQISAICICLVRA
ncbi:hypothetical protein [Pseudoflavonifractor sp. 524-17]|uniref:hypothetical protein n=1 Tax=Pseudoflavonifractor sp. 524-17 TaxID=2304577 RepID=UPI00137ABFDB|nr:hypothetical protein [Pseudoflavonifractor sp. 524-17]